ncbi:DUF433 domain-containing protein [Vineibacter terrae]|uniref:DUF433 domain-containing protein n=1 Tax=Vineibacter terrae TaxID=2586908 RepID=A0A5C8PD14_9HYPH|nr:DUF433 domain-containing protein [Vineibacter terrae]TXL70999.1 DUF433 domain-containing protein [Vineibacter terrae]
MSDWRNRITIDPGKMSGKACIRGMRFSVQDVLDYLAGGMTMDEMLAEFPYLEREDLQAALAYAAERERRTRILAA